MSDLKVRFTAQGGAEGDAAEEFASGAATVMDQDRTAELAARTSVAETADRPAPASPVAGDRKTAELEQVGGGAEDASWEQEFGDDGVATVIDAREPEGAAVASPQPSGASPTVVVDAAAVPAAVVAKDASGPVASAAAGPVVRRQTTRGGGTALAGRSGAWAIVAMCALATIAMVILAERDPAIRLLSSYVEGDEDADAEAAAAAAAAAEEAAAAAEAPEEIAEEE